MTNKSVEQQARDLLERMGIEDAQSFSSGDLVELANLITEVDKWKFVAISLLEQDANIFGELTKSFSRMRRGALDSLKIAERP